VPTLTIAVASAVGSTLASSASDAAHARGTGGPGNAVAGSSASLGGSASSSRAAGSGTALLYDSPNFSCEAGAASTSGRPYGSVTISLSAAGKVTVAVSVTGATPSSAYNLWVAQVPGGCPLATPTDPGGVRTDASGAGSAHITIAADAGATVFWVSVQLGSESLRSTAIKINGSGGGATTTPVLAQSVAAAVLRGTVLVEKPGTTTFVPLSGAALIPVGSTINAGRGRVTLTAAAATGHATYSGQFYDGEFRLMQARSGLTHLALTGGRPCLSSSAAKPTRAVRRQKLWGDAHGNFQTSGTYAAATVLGTQWLTEDTCKATIIRVKTGEVRVTNLVSHRSTIVRAPGTYTAGP